MSEIKLKDALKYEEQVFYLINFHKLKINNIDDAIKILKNVNYYRLSGYGIGLTKIENKEEYIDSISLNDIYSIYKFDVELRQFLFKIIEKIEIKLRTDISYYLGLKYGADGYLDEDNFISIIKKDGISVHCDILNKLNLEIDRQNSKPFVKHNVNKYKSKFPIWVAVELFSFGMLSSLYNIMKAEDKKEIALLYDTDSKKLSSWILCLVEIRNICAHYTRLYNMPLKQTPNLYKEDSKYICKQNKVFPIMLIIKRLIA